jgi:hypothetical protein
VEKVHYEELHNSYSSPNTVRMIKSRTMRRAGHVAHTGEMRKAYKIVVGKPEGKRPFGTRRCRWKDNIKMDLMEKGRERVN